MSDSVLDIKKDNKFGQLKAILYLLQTNLEDFKDEVDSSYELLKIGKKTPLSKKIEQKIDDPIKDIFEFTSKLDNQVDSFLDQIIRSFFNKNSNLIFKAFKTNNCINDLHYSIVLKKDSIEIRTKMFTFLDNFDVMDISKKHPIYFQFIPKELMCKINFYEEIKLD
ncbi:MAG: hypothetical protein JJU02_03820 [Cryomorphaceae bacterium]|nr:hypothetical protein [Cryomorphaceae bacterium]